MNANPKFLAATAEVDSAAVAPLPKSRKVYETGSRPDIRVPFREIEQADTPTMFGGEKNPPLTVYDCSGPYTDPDAKIDIRRGLPELRRAWIEERGDTELLAGPTSDYGKERLTDPKLTAMRFDLRRPPPRQVGRQRHPDALRAPRHHHAGNGIRGHPRKPAPRAVPGNAARQRSGWREDGQTPAAPASGPVLRRRHSLGHHARVRARRDRAAAPSSRPTSTTRKSSRWPSAATSW